MTALRVGLIGFGSGGRVFHAPLVMTTHGLELRFVVTSRAVPAPGEVLRTVEDLWARAGEVDVVVISTPNATHVPLARRALQLGLPVVLDKPLAPGSVEAATLVQEAAALGVPLTVFQNRRWDGDFLTLQALLADGVLGRVHRYESRFERWKPVPSTSWKDAGDPALGGGVVVDLGAHLVDQALLAFGPVASVYAEIGVLRAGGAAPDDGFISLTHTSGTVSHLWTSYLAAERGPSIRALGDRGTFSVWGMDPQEDALRDGMSPTSAAWGASARAAVVHDGATERPVGLVPGDYGAFYRQLVVALRDGGPLPVDARDSVEAIRVLELAARSAAEHRVVPGAESWA